MNSSSVRSGLGGIPGMRHTSYEVSTSCDGIMQVVYARYESQFPVLLNRLLTCFHCELLCFVVMILHSPVCYDMRKDLFAVGKPV